MTQVQNAKNKMYKSVLSFLTVSLAVFAGFKRLLTEITNFTDLNGDLDGFITQQGQVITGITEGKLSVFDTLVANTVAASRKALVYAKDQGDDAMQATLDVRVDDFEKATETNAVTRIQNIYTILNDNAVALADYMVSADDIAAIGTGLTTYATQKPLPSNAVSARVGARKSLVETMAAIDESLVIIDDLLEHTYMESNYELVETYLSNRVIDNDGVHHSGIRATMTDSVTGAGLEGGVMAIEALEKTGVADINGMAEIIKMKPGTYHVAFSAVGYVTQTLLLTIEKGNDRDDRSGVGGGVKVLG